MSTTCPNIAITCSPSRRNGADVDEDALPVGSDEDDFVVGALDNPEMCARRSPGAATSSGESTDVN
jgi:hypothetical protein